MNNEVVWDKYALFVTSLMAFFCGTSILLDLTPQTNNTQFMYDPISLLYYVSIIFCGKAFFSLCNTNVTLEILLAIMFVWSVHVKLLFINSNRWYSRKLNVCTLSI